jgi:hypothetical protein
MYSGKIAVPPGDGGLIKFKVSRFLSIILGKKIFIFQQEPT